MEDEPDDAHIVAWEWMSGETLLCNSAECVVRPGELGTNLCMDQDMPPITFRVQDDEGEWSEADTSQLTCPAVVTSITTQNQTATTPNRVVWLVLFAICLGGVCKFASRRYLLK